ncbi:hypothetical protein SAMN06269173_12126 [Hymenobacter mucosus]|uniref:Uncharacterized protein n=1 Tax=Hymenobacter mucosus TaxID=1411120 RepID=A0A239BD62_9BACT|nr:hypothetical protein SAMN06269173_12126 [Hymenobacter mucosus]
MLHFLQHYLCIFCIFILARWVYFFPFVLLFAIANRPAGGLLLNQLATLCRFKFLVGAILAGVG